MSRIVTASLVMLAIALTGCASTFSGIGGTEQLACKAPVGAMCTSVSGVYANSRYGGPLDANAAKPAPAQPASGKRAASYGAEPPTSRQANGAASATLRTVPRVLRLWVAPWEDADGDLHEEALVHVVVDTGRWLIEHVRPAVRSRMDRVTPPAAPATPQPQSQAPAESAPAPARFPLPPTGVPPVSLPASQPMEGSAAEMEP